MNRASHNKHSGISIVVSIILLASVFSLTATQLIGWTPDANAKRNKNGGSPSTPPPTLSKYSLTITATGGGSVTKSPDSSSYPQGTLVQVVATPLNGNVLDHWVLDGSNTGSANPITITMNAKHSLQAVFLSVPPLIQPPTTYTLGVVAANGGSVSLSPNEANYLVGTVVQAKGNPDTGSTLDHWILDGSDAGKNNPVMVTMDASHTIQAVFLSAPPQPFQPTYTVSTEGSSYVVRNSAGALVASGSDFGAVFNSLDSKLVSGNVVKIQPGTYLASTGARLSKSSVEIVGDVSNPSATIIRAASTSTPNNYLFQMGGSHNTISGLTFDANRNTVISPQFYLLGSYNTVRNDRFINALQYNLETSNADHFKIMDNYCTYSQYGIATMGFYSWSSYGLISGNTITDCLSAAIKIRCTLNTIVENNYIDTAYVQYKERYSYPSSEGMSGLYLALGDGPSQNVTFRGNTVVDTKRDKVTRGVFMENENTGYWLGLTSVRTKQIYFTGNSFAGLYYGIILNSDGINALSNIISGSRAYGIWVESGADGCILVGNIISGSGVADIRDNSNGALYN